MWILELAPPAPHRKTVALTLFILVQVTKSVEHVAATKCFVEQYITTDLFTLSYPTCATDWFP